MNDFGSQHPQQYASAGAAGRRAVPPPRPAMPGMAAQGRPAPRPQHYSAQQHPAQQHPAQQHPAHQGPPPRPPMQQGPAQQGPRQPVPAQRRPPQQSPAQQSPAQQGQAQQGQAQPQPGAWPQAQGSGASWPVPSAPAPWTAAGPPAGSGAPTAAPVDDDPAAVPTRKRGKAGKVIGLLVVAAALGGVGWVLANGSPAPVTAAVGQCVTQTGTDDIAVVGCGEPSAQFKVAGKLENKTVIDASLFACSDFPDATSSFWQGVEGKPGTVLCLAPVKPAAPAAP